MALTDAQILEKVKIGLNAEDSDDNDGSLSIKTLGVKQYMLGGGVSQALVETELGIATLTIGVNDVWNLESGVLKFSGIFNTLMTQLAIKSYV